MPAKSGRREKFKNPMKASTPTIGIQLETTTTSISTTSRCGSGSIGSALEWTFPSASLSLSLSLYLSVSPSNEISLRTAAHQKRKWVLCAPHPPTFVLQPLPRRHFHCHCHCYWKKSSFYFGVVQEKRRYVEEFIEPREIRKQHEKRNSFGAQSTPLNGGWNTQRGTHTHVHAHTPGNVL